MLRKSSPIAARATWLPLLLLLLLLASAWLPFGRLAAAEPLTESKWRREIYVPFDELNLLLEGQNQRVFLTREQYEQLLAKASPAEKVIPPWEAAVLSAEYDVSVENDRAVFRGELIVEGLRDGLHAVPLQLRGVGLRSASVDGQAAKLARDEQGQVQLLLDRLGRQSVSLELVAPLATTAAQQSLTFQVPTPSAARLRITVPGNVEVRSGASVLRREVDDQAGVTRLELLPQPGEIALRMSLNNRLLRRRQVVVARSVLVGEVTTGYERLHASLSLDVLQGAVEQFRFRVPAEFEITAVSSPLVSRWNVLPGDNGAVLEVTLREAVEGNLLLNVAALRTTPRTESWSFPRLEPLEVAGQVAVVGLLVEDRFEVETISSRELISIGTDVLTEALPDTIFEAEPGAPRIRPVAAFYAAQTDFGLDAQLNRPAPAFDARINLLLTLDNQRHQLRGGILVQPRVEQLLRFDFQLPAAWNVTQVQTASGEALPMERFSTDQGDTRVQVRLPAAVAPGGQFEVVFTAESTPAGWLAAWRNQPVQFPLVRVPDARQVDGALAVQPTDDLSLRPLQLEGLAPLDENEKPKYGLQGVASQLAYRFDTPQYAASFEASRDQAWVTAQTYAFYRLAPNNLSVHYELVFDVQRARVDELAFWLPAGTPPAVTIRALDGVELKEFNSQTDEGRRRWTVRLAERRSGVLRLAVDFRQRIAEDEPRGLALPPVQAHGVAYQTALIAVEGSAELDINVRTPGRRVDVGELYNAEYQVGRRLLGAYAFLGETADVQVDVFRRPGYQLPPAIVQRAEMVTLVAPGGRSQTAARFQLRTKAPYLELHLPAGTLWSVFLDGKGIAPQLDGDKILISLPAAVADQLRDLQVVYESSEQPTAATGVDVQGPRLYLRTDAGQTDREVPLADLVWHLYLSEGLTLTETGGSVSPVEPLTSPRPALKLLTALRGGIRELGPWIMRPARQLARDAKQALPSPYYLYDQVEGLDMAQTESVMPAATGEAGAMGGLGGGGFGLQGPPAAPEPASGFSRAAPPGAGPFGNEPPA
ncbi:MAG: hypothetical protein J5I93_11450, partial [Pirellulaceae bacterium]|nr:hypothetical protein [Pirellulaceae bacterium]